jgi:hypothetical protein
MTNETYFVERAKELFIAALVDNSGLRMAELLVEVTEQLLDDTGIKARSGNSNLIVEILNDLVKHGEIVEIEYTVPYRNHKLKSYYLPKGAEVVSISNKSLTLEISQKDFEILSRWASVNRTINESIRLLENYNHSLPTVDKNVGAEIDDISNNIGELQSLRPVFDNLNTKAKNIRFLQSNKKPE